MKTTLKYKFKRQSESYLDWLLNIVKSEKYYESEGSVMKLENFIS